MASTKIQVKGTALALNEDGRWELELRPADDTADGFYVLYEESDLAAAKKPLGKVTDARLVIGAEDDEHDADKLKEELNREIQRGADMEKQLAAALKKPEESMAAPAIGPDHPIVQLARGYFQVLHENALKYSNTAKGSDSGKFLELERTARAGLAKLEELVPSKKNGGAHVETPAPAAG